MPFRTLSERIQGIKKNVSQERGEGWSARYRTVASPSYNPPSFSPVWTAIIPSPLGRKPLTLVLVKKSALCMPAHFHKA